MRIVLAVAALAMLVSACGRGGPHGPPKQDADAAPVTAAADAAPASDAAAADAAAMSDAETKESVVVGGSGPHGPPS